MNKGIRTRSRLSNHTLDRLFFTALVLPTVAIVVLFILVPIIDSVYKSFLEYKTRNIITNTPGQWNDFHNYTRILSQERLWLSIRHTLLFVAGVVSSQFVLSLSLAVILNKEFRGSQFIRSIMMIPWVVPTIVSALIWMWIYQPQYGLLKYFAEIIGGSNSFAMLNNPSTALLGIVIAALWKQIPLMALLLLAGLQNVPDDILEAATIDGAGSVKSFFYITIPYLMPVIKVSISMSIIENFKQFPLFWTMTGGGPSGSTQTLAILSYREAFVTGNFGSGAAVTTIWMGLMIIVTVVYNLIFREQDMD